METYQCSLVSPLIKSRAAIVASLLIPLVVLAETPTERVIALIGRVETTSTQQGVSVATKVTDVAHDSSGFTFLQTTVAKTSSGTFTIKADYKIPLTALTEAKGRIDKSGSDIIKFIVEAPAGKKPFSVTVREYSTGAYATPTGQGEPVEGTESYFGFTFASMDEAEQFQDSWNDFVLSLKR